MSRRRGLLGFRAKVANVVDRIRESYWFWPMAMCFAAIASAVATSYFRSVRGFDPLVALGLAETVSADSARSVLSTVASSMLGVAGVSFSILVAAFAFASGQFGPRILTNFMRDRANQIVLGVFASTFLYCVIVLRLTGDDPVPSLAVFVALVAALVSVFALLFFFHHAPESIRLMRIVSDVGGGLMHEMAHLFPEGDAADAPDRQSAIEEADGDPQPVPSNVNGYARFIDHGSLLQIASDEDLVIRLDRRAGDYCIRDRPLAWVWPASRVDDALAAEIRECFSLGANRTPVQDVEFQFELLMDVASRALSPGINDPRTAMICLDWITAALARALKGQPRAAVRCDDDGNVRLIVRARRFQHLLEHAFGRLRPYFQTDPAAALHMMARVGGLILDAREEKHRQVLVELGRHLADGCDRELALEIDRKRVRERLEIIEQAARGELTLFEARGRHPWL